MSRGERGFTILEAVISLALTLLFLLITAGLLRDAQLASLALRRQALDPTPQHIAQNLRHDVHRSRRVELPLGSGVGSWSYSALSLTLPDGGTVRYEKSNEEISRTLVAADGTSSGARPLMRSVLSWRWLQIAPDLVEIEIVFRRRPSNEGLRRTASAPGPTVETLQMRLALRAIPGKRSW